MLHALIVAQILLWIVVTALGVMVLALLRQVGVLHERIAPIGALTLDHGPKEGETAPIFDLQGLAQQQVRIGGVSQDGRSTLIFFLSPTCPVCKKLLPIVKSISRSESRWLRIVLASDGEQAEQERMIRSAGLAGYPYVLSTELGMRYKVSRLPYGVLIDEQGVVRAKGLVNTREHLESLMQAKEMGVPSIQEYIRARPEIGS